MKNPNSIAAIAGKYEFEIMSGTASFKKLLPLYRGVHRDIAAALVRKVAAELEVVAARRHLRLLRQIRRPVAEVVTVPRRLRRERRQAEPLPDRARVVHELAPGQRDRRKLSLEHGVDQDGRRLAAVAVPAWTVARILMRQHDEIVLRLAAVGHRPKQRVGVLRIDVGVDGDDPFAGETVQRGGAVERAPDFALRRAARAPR